LCKALESLRSHVSDMTLKTIYLRQAGLKEPVDGCSSLTG